MQLAVVVESNRAIYAALAGNVAVAVTKFIAAAVTGSSAMLAEAFHSAVDTGDSLVLLWGTHRSRRPPDPEHPFGHGQELYFWTFVVAILIFAVGGGFSVFEGAMRLRHPHPAENVAWSYLVLGLSFLFEAGSFVVGYRQFRREADGRSLWKEVRTSKDPATFTVVFEDTAALVGIVIAFLGIWLAERFRQPAFDAWASIAIGLLLMLVAMLLARESKGLLVGEAMDRASLDELRRLVQEDPAVRRMNRPLTVHFGPEAILLAVEIEFDPNLAARDVAGAVQRIEKAVRTRFPKISRIFVEAEAIGAAA